MDLKSHHRHAREAKLRKTHGKDRGVGNRDNMPRRGANRNGQISRTASTYLLGDVATVCDINDTVPFSSGRVRKQGNFRTPCNICVSGDEMTVTHSQLDSESAAVSGQCPICLETLSVVKLMKNCNHPSACHDCLRKVCIETAQGDVANYPLRCFYPSCDRIIREVQLERHSLVSSQRELRKHRRLTFLAKANARNREVSHCPGCDHPEFCRKTNRIVACWQCSEPFLVEADKSGEDNSIQIAGSNVRVCKRCGNGVEHAGGCFKMKCRCGFRFCFVCGSENAQCGHTPTEHGYVDNGTGMRDFRWLGGSVSRT